MAGRARHRRPDPFWNASSMASAPALPRTRSTRLTVGSADIATITRLRRASRLRLARWSRTSGPASGGTGSGSPGAGSERASHQGSADLEAQKRIPSAGLMEANQERSWMGHADAFVDKAAERPTDNGPTSMRSDRSSAVKARSVGRSPRSRLDLFGGRGRTQRARSGGGGSQRPGPARSQRRTIGRRRSQRRAGPRWTGCAGRRRRPNRPDLAPNDRDPALTRPRAARSACRRGSGRRSSARNDRGPVEERGQCSEGQVVLCQLARQDSARAPRSVSSVHRM